MLRFACFLNFFRIHNVIFLNKFATSNAHSSVCCICVAGKKAALVMIV